MDGGARAIALRFVRGERTATEVVRDALDAIAATAKLDAWVHVAEHEAMQRAALLDHARADGTPMGPLAAVPIGLKDNFITRGIPTTAGSRILGALSPSPWLPPFEGEHDRRTRDAGAVLVGKLSLDEFAMGSANENVPGRPARNPWAIDRSPGGSSGGAAAAVAAGVVPLAVGSDTGGSVRQPAAMCGVVGFKPTYGRVPRAGMIAFASSLDQAGSIARSVRDAALLLVTLAGPSPGDATCVAAPPLDLDAAADRSIRGLRIGVPRRALEAPGLDPQVAAAFEQALVVLRERGAVTVDVDLPHADLGVATYYVIASAEAASNLARYDGIRYGPRAVAHDLETTIEKSRTAGFGPEVRRRILLGTFVLRKAGYDAYFGQASRVRSLVAADHDAAFASCDVLATPTAPTPALPLGRHRDDPLAAYLGDVFTVGANLAGLPAISVPCGFTRTAPRLPLGLQLVAPAWREDVLVAVAAAYEADTPWHDERPPLCETPGGAGPSA